MPDFMDGVQQASKLVTATDTRAAVAHVIKNYQAWGAPTADERRDFLQLLGQWMAGEMKKDGSAVKAMADERVTVIKRINQYCDMFQGRPAFSEIDRDYFAVELALRVRMPKLIDQGDTGLCGAASVMYNFAKAQPAKYASFALGLFFRGKGKFNDMEVSPSDVIRNGYTKRFAFMDCPADYVTLVSLRACTLSPALVGALRASDETTLPGQIGRWLALAGYQDIEADTFFNANWLEKLPIKALAGQLDQPVHHGNAEERTVDTQGMRQNLQRAADALAGGKFVILFTDVELSKFLQGKVAALVQRNSSASLGQHHFVAARRLQLAANDVTVRLITWTTSFDRTIPLDRFLPRYNGYLAARP